MDVQGALAVLSPQVVVLAVLGAGWGLAADRLATRWPYHDEAEGFLPGRRPGWRTVVVGAFGAVGLGLLPTRFEDPLDLVLFGAYVLALVVLLATDLDQRLLPDLLTLPAIPLAFLFALSGQNPLVGDQLIPAMLASILIPAVLYLPSLAFGPGAFGLGDVKLLVSVGLVVGAYRAIAGTMVGILLSGVVIVALLATRRISLKSFIPFGPFLIIGALWAVLLRTT